MRSGVLLAVVASVLPGGPAGRLAALQTAAAQAEETLRAREAITRQLVETRSELGRAATALERVRLEMAASRERTVSRALATSKLHAELAFVERHFRATTARLARAEVPEAWLAQDPADSLYRAAREALNRGRYERAASLFAGIRERFPRSGYVGDSYYFQALALQREGNTRSLRRAVELLAEQQRRHADASTIEDARALRVRLEGQLARTGDAQAAASIQERAAAGCESEEQELRSAALGALLQMDSERALPILREVLKSRDACSGELRKQAVFLVSQKMTPETIDILLELAHRNPDPDPQVREAAVFWLSQVRSDEAVTALESILRTSDDPVIQEKAIFAISQHRSPRAASVLRDYARRSDVPTELREKAIFWIGQGRGEENKAFLRDLYGELGDEELRKKVIFGVAQAPGEADRRWLIDLARDGDETVEMRKQALFWAGQSGGVPASDLRDMYRTLDDPEMKEQVIFVLSQARGEEPVTALMEIAEAEEDAKLRQRAIFWLGQNDDPRVPEFLLRIIRGGGR